jgi:hypothetical protein
MLGVMALSVAGSSNRNDVVSIGSSTMVVLVVDVVDVVLGPADASVVVTSGAAADVQAARTTSSTASLISR